MDVGKSVMNPITASIQCKLKKALKEINPDVCLTFTIRPAIYGNMVTSRLKIPTISTITGTGPLFDSKSLSYTHRAAILQICIEENKVCFFSQL